jgi:putative peptidoglycan lipid II flippase
VIAAPAGPADLARSTATMTLLTLASRVTGLIRIAVVTAVLGDTFLGNTYQSANTVPNLLFELLAAGVLQATLIPTLVGLLDAGKEDEADHVAGAVLGSAMVLLAGLAVVGAVTAPLLARGLLHGIADPEVRHRQVHLATVLLWCFLPQVVLYAANTVATASLNARHRFGIPVFAPLLNNVVVTASYGLFAFLRHGADPDVPLRAVETAVLGLGTTAGVIAFCALPVVAARRAGARLRPRIDPRHPQVRRIARLGGWAAAFLAATQVLLAVVLVLANRVEGGVVAWQLAFTLFLLPHALAALPVLTTLFPTLARQHAQGDEAAFARSVGTGVRSISFLVLPAAAALLALGRPLAQALRVGHFGASGADQVALALAAFAPGLIGYGCFLFLARALYARGDTRTPALVNLVVVTAAGVLMVGAFGLAHGSARVAALAGVHSAAYLAGAGALLRLVRQRVPDLAGERVLRGVAGAVAAAVLAGAVMGGSRLAFHPPGRLGGLATVVLGGALGLATYLVASPALGGPTAAQLPGLLRGAAVSPGGTNV